MTPSSITVTSHRGRRLWVPPPPVPLVVGPDQAGPVHRQDPIADLQPAVGGGGSVGDQRADVDARGVEGCVLRRERGVGAASREDGRAAPAGSLQSSIRVENFLFVSEGTLLPGTFTLNITRWCFR